MSCALVRRHVGTFVDQELDPATQIEFERHLSGCPECRDHVVFEREFRARLRGAVGGVQAPPELRARILQALDEEPEQKSEPLVRWIPVKWQVAVPMAAAAAVMLVVGGSLPFSSDSVGVQGAATTGASVFDDVARLHSSELPSDVREPAPQRVSHYFQDKLSFPVRPAEFGMYDARLTGARLSNVRDRRAAVLYYELNGRRMTVVVFDSPPDIQAERVELEGHELMVRHVGGYTIPVRHHAGLSYAFTGDFDRDTLFQLAASARVGR